MNPELAMAHFFHVVAIMLVAYLAACGINALGEMTVRWWRQRKGASHGHLF